MILKQSNVLLFLYHNYPTRGTLSVTQSLQLSISQKQVLFFTTYAWNPENTWKQTCLRSSVHAHHLPHAFYAGKLTNHTRCDPKVIKTESLLQKAELGSTLRKVLLQLAKRKFIVWQVEHTGRNMDNNAFSLVIQQCCLYYLTLKDNCSNLKPGFHMIVQIVLIIPVIPNNVQTVRTIIWNHNPDNRKQPGWLRWPRSLGENWVLSGGDDQRLSQKSSPTFQ